MKAIALGTAMWGWSVDKTTAFNLLDVFYQEGYRYVDTARNYPINSNKIDFMKALHFLSEWTKINYIKDLKIIYKVGSLSNNRTIDNNLTYDFLAKQIEEVYDLLGSNLYCNMIHWDNRNEDSEIEATCECLKYYLNSGFKIGLSGISNKSLYYKYLYRDCANLYIEGKSNLIQNDELEYLDFIKQGGKFFAYGISMGGIKLSKDEYTSFSYVTLARDKSYHDKVIAQGVLEAYEQISKECPYVKNLYNAAIYNSEKKDLLYGYIVAPSKVSQISDIIDFVRCIR